MKKSPPVSAIEVLLLNAALPLLVGTLSAVLAKEGSYSSLAAFVRAYGLMDLAGAWVIKMHRDVSWKEALLQLLTLAFVAKALVSLFWLTARLVVLNPSLKKALIWGPIDAELPHIRGRHFLGHLKFDVSLSEALTQAALQTQKGVATFWIGPIPVLFVARNSARLSLIRESQVGVINQDTQNLSRWFFANNNIMHNFPLFQPNDSDVYQQRRTFLMKLYHQKATIWLSGLEKLTSQFLDDDIKKQGSAPRPLREVVTLLVLHTSSFLLGLNDKKLDEFYTIPDYRHVIDHVAHYCVADRADPVFESKAYDLFLEIFRKNFNSISSSASHGESADANLIQNLFSSINLPFPKTLSHFESLPKTIRHDIAMAFCAIGLAGMVHSTTNTLDWALARLLMNQQKMKDMVDCVGKNEESLTEESIYDKKNGSLFPLTHYVLYNVFLHPPFPLEFYYNQQRFTADLGNNDSITVPAGSFIVVNYKSCNLTSAMMCDEETFSQALDDTSTIMSFLLKRDVASFGGSPGDKKTRRCPGARVSLLEQLIILAVLLRDYDFTSEALTCEEEPRHFPLHTRVNSGQVFIHKKNHTSSFFRRAELPLPPPSSDSGHWPSPSLR